MAGPLRLHTVDLQERGTNPFILASKSYMVSGRVLGPQSKNVQGLLCAQICIQSFWGPADSRSFHKGGYEHAICPYGHGVWGPVRNPAADKGPTFHFRDPRAKQGGSHCTRMGSVVNLSPFSQPALPPCSLLALCFSRRGWKGSWGHCSPGFCTLGVYLAHSGLRQPQLWGTWQVA